MNESQFQRGMRELGCSDSDMEKVFRLIGSLSRTYPWINRDDLLTLGLEMVPRARSTYSEDRPASFSTHLVTVVRNACCSYLSKESQQRRRGKTLIQEPVDTEVQEDPAEQASFRDCMLTLSRVLSPFAWSLLVLTLEEPGRATLRGLAVELGVSVVSVSHLRNEVRSAVRFVTGEKES